MTSVFPGWYGIAMQQDVDLCGSSFLCTHDLMVLLLQLDALYRTKVIQHFIDTLFEKSNFCPKNQFHEFFTQNFFDNFSREIKVVNS